ncbi:hypothetical protein [Sphingomonas sp. 1185]|uniref:hypothetical protein n=1 Tax=Sphingomonas sp. 1185 TaxID=3156411 RepID=UPI003398A257
MMTDPNDAQEHHDHGYAALPEMCAVLSPITHQPIVIERGHAGHWPLPDDMTIERINAVFKAAPPQIEAMLVGSMFGWDVPGADPSRYDTDGRPRRS